MTVKTDAPLAAIEKTLFLPTRGGGRQCWGARTTDKAWDFERLEIAGTPWAVTHKETGIVVDSYAGTLDDCRAYVANGGAQADLERIQSHQRGEHEAERDKGCPKC
jgi:hypothetical protein